MADSCHFLGAIGYHVPPLTAVETDVSLLSIEIFAQLLLL